ncbi:TonB-dependent receptor [Polymorphobacter sp.]|uniref:TonB-dependent receptor n=1 Tax=Polymorphobacter sp. TaxID=1909290 RepID=UPI003F6FE36D
MRSSVCVLALVAALPALAQEATPGAQASVAAGDDGTIIVTARRRAESLQNVPIAITAFSSDRIDREGISNIADIAKLTPSLVFDRGFSPQDNRPSIRGLPATRGRPPVAILMDGIDMTTESIATAGGGNLMNLRLADFERIEVVKGPQSALYGRSAFGGAVNYVTKEPGDVLGGYVSGDLGLQGRAEIRGAIDLPASETFSVRINGVYSRFDGFFDNSTTGNRLGGYETYGGAISAKWEPNADTKIIARVSYSDDAAEQQAAKYYGINVGLSVPVAMPANVVGQRVGSGNLPASVLMYRKGTIENENVPIQLSPDPIDPTGRTDYPGARTKNLIASLRGTFDFGPATLSTWTGYVNSKGSTISDVDYFGRAYQQVARPAPGGLGEFSGTTAGNGFWQFDIDTEIDQFSQEVRLSGRDDLPFRWAVGGLYWYEKVAQDDRRFLSFGLGQPASTSLNVALQGGRSTQQPFQGRTTKHYSGYAMLEYDLLPTLTVSAEGRYARETLDYVFGQSVGIQGGANLALGPAPFILTGVNATASQTTNYFTPRGIVTWKPTSDVMIYASAARGIKPGGFTQVGSADPDLGRYEKEQLSSYEVGGKFSLFDRRLTVNVAAFRLEYSDKQTATLIEVPFSVNPQGALSVTTNAGGARIDGQEIDFRANITPELVFSGGYTHLNARYTDFVFNSTTAFTIARSGNCTIITVGTQQTCQINQTGNRMELAPEHSGTASLAWTKDIGNGLNAYVEASGQFRGRRFLSDDNAWSLKSYGMLDLRFGFQTDQWSAIIYIDNVLDDQTIKSAINLLDVASGNSGALNMIAYMPDPRQAGIRVRYNF